jgi:hypothetical protein
MRDGMLHDGHTTSDLALVATCPGTTVNLNPRTPAAARDSDALDSTAADLPLATSKFNVLNPRTLSASGLRVC